MTPVTFKNAYSAADWDTLQQVFFNWTVLGSGLPEQQVIWGQQDEARPPGPAITMRVSNINAIGRMTERSEDNVLVFADKPVTAVDTAADTLAITAHGLHTGDGPIAIASTGTLPAPLVAATDYWVIAADADHVQIASTFLHTGGALGAGGASTPINLTSAGSGTITLVSDGDTRPAGQEIKRISEGYLSMTLELHSHSAAGVGPLMAQAFLQRVHARRQLPSQQYVFQNANVALVDIDRVRAVQGVRDAALFEPRAYLEVHVCVPVAEFEYDTFIAQVQLTNLGTGQTVTVG